MKQISKWLENNFFYIIGFIFFLVINFLSPPIFDDWEISAWFANNNLLSLLTTGIYGFWLGMNGRALTNVVMIVFTYFDLLWDITSAILFVFIMFFFNNKIKNKNYKFTVPLTFLLLISVSQEIRMEAYSYISANVAFIFGFALTLVFYLFAKKNITKGNRSKLLLALFSVFSFTIGSWMENLSAGFVASLLFVNIFYLVKYKRLNFPLFFSFIFSSLGLLFLFTSPGMRTVRGLNNENESLYNTFKISFPRNIDLVVYQNRFIFSVLAFLNILLIKTNNIKLKNKIFTNLYIGFLIFIFLVLTVSLISPYVLGHLDLLNTYINNYLFTLRLSRAIFWFGFLLSLILPIYYLKQNREIAFLTYTYITFSLLPLFFINQTGNRIIAVPIICYAMLATLFCTQIIIKNAQIWKIGYYALILAIIIQVTNWLELYTSINKTQKVRESIIKEVVILQSLDKWSYEKDVVTIPKFQKGQVLNNGTSNHGEFHHLPFLKYYHLNENTQLVFK